MFPTSQQSSQGDRITMKILELMVEVATPLISLARQRREICSVSTRVAHEATTRQASLGGRLSRYPISEVTGLHQFLELGLDFRLVLGQVTHYARVVHDLAKVADN
jgi:hypothetical protein